MILIVLIFSIYFALLIADNPNKEISQTKSLFYPDLSLTCGIQYGLYGVRTSLKYYAGTLNFTGRYTEYGLLFIGTRSGSALNHKEFALTINKVVYSPYSNIHCSLGSGLLYRIRKVRDERISYENWTSNHVYDVGIPIELNLENFLTPTSIVINFGYKANLFRKEVFHAFFFDFGIYFGSN